MSKKESKNMGTKNTSEIEFDDLSTNPFHKPPKSEASKNEEQNIKKAKFSRQGQPTREEATINNLRQSDASKDKFINLFDKFSSYEPSRIVKATFKKAGLSFTQQQIDLILDIVDARREQLKMGKKKKKKKEEQVKTEREQPHEGISFDTREEATINNLRQSDAAKDKFIDLFDKLPYEPERIVKAAYKKFGVSFTQQQIDLILDIVEARREQLKAEKKKDEQVKTEREQPQEGISFDTPLDPEIQDAIDNWELKEKNFTRYVRRLLRSRLIPKALKLRIVENLTDLTKSRLSFEQIQQLADAFLADANTFEEYVAKYKEIRKDYNKNITNEETTWGITALVRLGTLFANSSNPEGIKYLEKIYKILKSYLLKVGSYPKEFSNQIPSESLLEFIVLSEMIRINKQRNKERIEATGENDLGEIKDSSKQVQKKVMHEIKPFIDELNYKISKMEKNLGIKHKKTKSNYMNDNPKKNQNKKGFGKAATDFLKRTIKKIRSKKE